MDTPDQEKDMQYQPFMLNELAVPEVLDGESAETTEEEFLPVNEAIQQQAQDILDEARKQAEEIEREAYEQGFKQGEKDGQEIGSMKLVKILDRIEEICEDLDSFHGRFVHLHEKEILGLICTIASKVVKAQVELDQDVVKQSVLEALETAADWQEVTVRVDPTDYEFLEDMRPEFFEKLSKLQSINIVPVASIDKGGCIVSADFGEVDASLETRMDKVTQAILDAYYSKRI